ncbi:beta-ketoacyl-[acyl-carrier-protein] synthase family protein [Paenibacillus lutrae]
MGKGALVTGTNMLCSLGVTNGEVWKAALAGAEGPRQRSYRFSDNSCVEYPVYTLPDWRPAEWLGRQTAAWLSENRLLEDADFCMLLVSVRQALEDAGFSPGGSSRVGLVIGHENLGVVRLTDKFVQHQPELGRREREMPLFKQYQHEFFNLQTFPYLFYLAQLLGINGPSYAVNNACASGLYALELGRMMIETGSADLMIVSCSDYAHVSEYLWLQEKGFVSGRNMIRPFDLHRDGSILGDGAATIVLESEEHAARRGASPIGLYRGGRFVQDHWHMTLPDVSRHSYASVISGAAELEPDREIDILVPHGSGSTLWDRYEAAEIQRAFAGLERPLPAVTAFKGYFGHLLGASAMIETVLMLHCMKHNTLLPALNHEYPDPKIKIRVQTQAVSRTIRSAVKSVPAYGGFHAAVLFNKLE